MEIGLLNISLCIRSYLTPMLTQFQQLSRQILLKILPVDPWADPERGGGGQGVQTPLKNHRNIGFLSHTGPDSPKIAKLSSQHLNGFSLPGRLWPVYCGICTPLPSSNKQKQKTHYWTPSDKTVCSHVMSDLVALCRTVCFTPLVFFVPCDCYRSLPLSHGAMS